MKLTICLLALCLASAAALANEPVKTLGCGTTQDPTGRFTATLDPNAFDAGSGYYEVSQPFVDYEFSSAALICNGNKPEELNCIGYWNTDDVAEVHTSKDSRGNIVADFKTSKPYGNKPIHLTCTLN